MKKIVLCLYLIVPCLAFAQAGSEIYLFDLKIKKDAVSISNGKNITNHAGYDNQPSFHPDEPIVYYTSFNDEGGADIKSFNYKTSTTTNVTTTSEREYSPTVTPDKQFLSCIIQRDNNAQDLGKYPIKGGEPVVLINDLIVGYHTWINAEQLMLFVLGQPQTLQLYDLKTKQHGVIEENIGRSLHKIPGEEAVSYVFKKSADEWIIKKFEPASKASSEIKTAPKSSEDLCWTPDGRILISSGMKLYFTDPQREQEWKEVVIDTPFAKNISRIAVSKDGKKLAVVVAE